jgi:hypothetical protein
MNKELGVDIFQHGEESFNPGTPESYGANVIFYKGEVYHINDERSYLAFLFHQHDHLTNHCLNIHPSVFRERKPPPDETDITEMWMDLMQFQVLIGGFGENIKNIGGELIQEYNAAVKRFNEIPKNKNNQKHTFEAMKKFLKDTKTGEGPGISQKLQDEKNKINKIYYEHQDKTKKNGIIKKMNIKLFEELSKENRESTEGNWMTRWIKKKWNEITSFIKPTENKRIKELPTEKQKEEKNINKKRMIQLFQKFQEKSNGIRSPIEPIKNGQILFSKQQLGKTIKAGQKKQGHPGIPFEQTETKKPDQLKGKKLVSKKSGRPGIPKQLIEATNRPKKPEL